MQVSSASQNPFFALRNMAPDSNSPWRLSLDLFKRVQSAPLDATMSFRSCEVLSKDPEHKFITTYYQQSAPQGLVISKITVFHNPTHTSSFENAITDMNKEVPKFLPSWDKEALHFQRKDVHARWERMKDIFHPMQLQNTNRNELVSHEIGVLPLFHGTTDAVCTSVASTGFVFFGKHKGTTNTSTDIGYFGSGIYFTNSIKYAALYSQGVVVMAWVSMRPPYPVVSDASSYKSPPSDMKTLAGMGAYKDYNAHFIPVSSVDPKNPCCMNYYPTINGDQPAWDEFVVFQKSQTLPRFRIELSTMLLKAPSVLYSPALCRLAIEAGRRDIVETWLKEDPTRLKERDTNGETFLHIAARFDRDDIAAMLLKETTILNFTDENGFTAFHVASASGSLKVAKLLLLKKPEYVNIASKSGMFPIHLAFREGNLPFIKWLALVDKQSFYRKACKYQTSPYQEYLYEVDEFKGKEQIFQDWLPLHFAIASGQIESVRFAIENMSQGIPNLVDGCNPLHLAAELGQLDIVKFLNENDPAWITKWRNQPNKAGYTPLLTATFFNQIAVLKQLCQLGCSITVKDIQGYLPIHWVAKRGSVDGLNTLIKFKAVTDVKGSFERTPLDVACFHGHLTIAQILISLGANINSKTSSDDGSKTPLHEAVASGRTDLVRLLASYTQLNVNIEDNRGHSPLWYAVVGGAVDSIPILIQHPSYIRQREGSNSIEELLTERVRDGTDIALTESVRAALKQNS